MSPNTIPHKKVHFPFFILPNKSKLSTKSVGVSIPIYSSGTEELSVIEKIKLLSEQIVGFMPN